MLVSERYNEANKIDHGESDKRCNNDYERVKIKSQERNGNRLTAVPLTSFLGEGHCYHPKLAAKRIVNQQHNPENPGENLNEMHQKSTFQVNSEVKDT